MKACLLVLLIVTAQSSILATADLAITDIVEYSVLEPEAIPEDLSVYDVVVIATPSRVFTEEENERLKTFVEAGGGLMLLAEDNNKEGTTLALNQLSQLFSITFNVDRIYDDKNYVEHTSWVSIGAVLSHPVFQGVTTIVYMSGCSLAGEGILVKTGATAYAEKYDGLITHEKGDNPACMAFLEVGEGRIFACGDTELFDQHLSLADNTIFALNVFDWLTGNPDRIGTRLETKSQASQSLADVESLLVSVTQKGLQEVQPASVETAETLLSDAKTLYDTYRYADSLQKAGEARHSLKEGESKAQTMTDSQIKAAEECLSRIEKGAKKYLPSQYEAAVYYLKDVETQITYAQKMEKAGEALNLCEEISTGLQGAADKEVSIASEKVEAYSGLFGRKSNHSARVFLEYAEESYARGYYGDAIEYAQQSQIYSEKAAEEQKKDYILVVMVVVIGAFAVYLYVRK